MADFNLGFPFDLDFLDSDDDTEELLKSIDIPPISSINNESLQSILTEPAIQGLPAPETPSYPSEPSTKDPKPNATKPSTSRFKSLTEEEIRQLEDQTQSKSTKKNTKWGVSIFQDWHVEKFGYKADFKSLSKSAIAEKLRSFYCEATPKNTEGRAKGMPKEQATEYHRNSLVNMRAAINRHLHDLDIDVDIVRDKDFIHANRALDGTLKNQTKKGTARATEHKKVINNNDLRKISTYLSNGYQTSPIVLRHAVWFLISMHFVTRGMEFHYQLFKNSLEIKVDENGDEYASLTQETLQKNFQGGLCSEEAPQDRRMYAVNGSELCPLQVLKFYIDHLHPGSTHLFNHCDKEAILYPDQKSTWFMNKPLSKKGFSNFMRDMVKAAELSESYTPHCLRATAIQKMNDAGHEARHIMFMSGHRSEASLRSYNRECSTKQKKDLSMTLACAAAGNDSISNIPALPCATITSPDSDSASDCDQRQLAVSTPEADDISTPSQNDNRSYMSQFLSTSGFMARSSFQNCTFNFKM